MIQVNELRIGNYINHNDGSQTDDIRRVSGIHKDGVESVIKGCKFATAIRHQSLVYAIPLTEEILLKCGFQKYAPSIFNEDRYVLGFVSLIVTNSKDILFNGIHIKHLHQLQNLYFALTGKELHIEL